MSKGANVLPIVVVGAGPVGLVAALAARHQGLPVVVFGGGATDRIGPEVAPCTCTETPSISLKASLQALRSR